MNRACAAGGDVARDSTSDAKDVQAACGKGSSKAARADEQTVDRAGDACLQGAGDTAGGDAEGIAGDFPGVTAHDSSDLGHAQDGTAAGESQRRLKVTGDCQRGD